MLPILLVSCIWARVDDVDAFLRPRLSSDSIVTAKQIKIPNYPGAYNPSLIPYQDGYLLSFRCTSRLPSWESYERFDASFIGIAKLDKKFNVMKNSVQLLEVISSSERFSLTAEDARLLNVGDRIFIFFNDLPPSQNSGFAMYFAQLQEEDGVFLLKEPAKHLKYQNAISIEKNWSPFFSNGNVYVIYSSQPRVILEVDLDTGNCLEVVRTYSDWNWDLGQIRGGTPAYLIDEQFLSFFHSSFPANIRKGRAFAMGAYLFDKAPPFSIRKMTSFPIGNLADYTEENPSKVIFPAGLVITDQSIFVSWGKNDKQIFITTIDKKKLLESMTDWMTP